MLSTDDCHLNGALTDGVFDMPTDSQSEVPLSIPSD